MPIQPKLGVGNHNNAFYRNIELVVNFLNAYEALKVPKADAMICINRYKEWCFIQKLTINNRRLVSHQLSDIYLRISILLLFCNHFLLCSFLIILLAGPITFKWLIYYCFYLFTFLVN